MKIEKITSDIISEYSTGHGIYFVVKSTINDKFEGVADAGSVVTAQRMSITAAKELMDKYAD